LDVESRLKKHLSNHNGFTGKTKDWEVQYVEKFATKSAALKREKQLKGWKSKIRIRELIERNK
jgi:putative endonuclease